MLTMKTVSIRTITWGLAAAMAIATPVLATDHEQTRQRQERQERRERNDGPEQTERVSRTLQVDPNGEMEISNISGNITVTGGSGRELRVDALKRVRGGDTEETKRQLALLEVAVDQRGS